MNNEQSEDRDELGHGSAAGVPRLLSTTALIATARNLD
jgi:hypothetical protein